MSKIDRTVAFAFTFTVTCVGASAGCYVAVDKSAAAPTCVAGDPQCVAPEGVTPTTTPTGPNSPGYSPGSISTSCGESPGIGAGGCGGAGGTGGGPATGPNAPLPRAPGPPATCPTIAVSRFRELMIVDPGVTGDARADNGSSYRPWSFRQRIEDLVPGNPDGAASLASDWLMQWSSLTEVPITTAPGAARVPIEPRPAMSQVLSCPWLALSLENGCNASCNTCRAHRLDLAHSPFRLLAIANRGDTAGAAATAACGGGGGELRFVYGAADPATLRVLPFTMIFEYTVTLAPGETLRDWASAWHDLGALSPGTSAYNASLDAVVAKGLARATLRRVLTNEVASGLTDGLPWEMRQFVPALTDAGTVRLLEVATAATPRLTLAPTSDLAQWIDDNAAAVLAGDNPLPATMLAASAPIPTANFTWDTSANDPVVATAFNRNTCNGCHGGRTDPADLLFQHIAPATSTYASGGAGSLAPARLSRFLNDPGRDDELGRRERQLGATLCTPCSTDEHPPY